MARLTPEQRIQASVAVRALRRLYAVLGDVDVRFNSNGTMTTSFANRGTHREGASRRKTRRGTVVVTNIDRERGIITVGPVEERR